MFTVKHTTHYIPWQALGELLSDPTEPTVSEANAIDVEVFEAQRM
jgi:hypothetical protein